MTPLGDLHIMGTSHVTHVEIEKFARRELPPDEVLRVGRHIGGCAACAALAREAAAGYPVEDVFSLDHPDASSLAAYADGTLHDPDLQAHIDACPRCREDVADLAEMRAPLAGRRPRFAYAAAAAAAIAIAGGAVLLLRSPREVPRPPARHIAAAPAYARADWNDAVRDAVRTGAVAPPRILTDLRPPPERLRGSGRARAAVLSPAGVIVESTRPRFTWTPVARARYVVSVFDGSREVANSGVLTSPSWTPPFSLPRNAALTWQVEARRGAATEILPYAPASPAMFRILDEATAGDLAEAQRRYPNDHLLLGVLYARAGLQQRAEEELRASTSPAAARIREGVGEW
jgi:hypothetical protein